MNFLEALKALDAGECREIECWDGIRLHLGKLRRLVNAKGDGAILLPSSYLGDWSLYNAKTNPYGCRIGLSAMLCNQEGDCMVKVKIILPDGRIIPCNIRDRHYRRLDQKISNLNFWQRIKLLFFKST